MLNKLTLTLAVSTFALFLCPKIGTAQSVLNQATIESLQNQVRLIPNQQNARSARVSDVLRVRDTIATANSSRVDLRFNDRSLARLGSQAVFRFQPGTRSIDLNHGTGLFLINPGQGTTTIRTPNAAAGIRGSALFVRVIPGENGTEGTTVIGALTNSGIQTCSQNGSQCVGLKAGQMAHFQGDQLQGVYQFDLATFLNTSPLTQDLEQVAPPEVLGELQEAVLSVAPLEGEVLENPEFIQMPEELDTEFPETDLAVVELDFGSGMNNNIDNGVLENITALDPQETTQVGEIRLNTPFPGGGATGGVFPGGGATGGNFPGGGGNKQ